MPFTLFEYGLPIQIDVLGTGFVDYVVWFLSSQSEVDDRLLQLILIQIADLDWNVTAWVWRFS